MADFTQKSSVKSATYTLAEPIADIGAFNALIQSVIMSNPFGCVSYMTTDANHPPVEKVHETYTARIAYRDSDAKTVGVTAETYSTIAGFNTGIATILANTANTAAHRGNPVLCPDADSYSATLRCHDPGGEIYYVNFSRRQVTLSSYEDDRIRTRIEIWADSVPAL